MNAINNNLDLHPIADRLKDDEQVPVIDIAGLFDEVSGGSANTIVEQIASACKNWGFFQIVNHGIDQDDIDLVLAQMHRFFALPANTKQRVLRTRDNPWGYYNNELTKNQRDKKEVFDFTADGVDPVYHSRNRWPEDRQFKIVMLDYIKACSDLSLRLLEAFCVGLDLPPDFLHNDFKHEHTGFIRLNYYPVSDPLANSHIDHQPIADLGVHHHTDAGALTLLLQDDTGGLQVYRDGYWHDIPPLPGAFVVNTGDMMQVWSNDIYQAAIHRVLAMDSRDRYSIPFFYNPSAESKISPLGTTVNADRPGRYETIEWSKFRGQRTDGDFADYGTEVQISQYKK